MIALDPIDPWSVNIKGAWLVKVEPNNKIPAVSYKNIAPASCSGCGSQRPGINVAPAVSSDGTTIYTASLAHFDPVDAYLLAVNPNLTPKWQSSLTVAGGGIQGAGM